MSRTSMIPPCPTNKPSKASDTQVGGNHYKNMDIEPWDVIDTWPMEQRIGFYRGCALKYLMRMGTKDEKAQEIEKGIHCMQKLVEVLREHERPNNELVAEKGC